MEFPRLKNFNFEIESTYIVPSHRVGNLLLIAYDLFEDVRYYKPIAEANGINISLGHRVGIRPVEEALRLELKNDGYSPEEIERIVYQKMIEKRPSESDWNDYGYPLTDGYMSDVSEGKLLLIPTLESATDYLDKFERLTEE